MIQVLVVEDSRITRDAIESQIAKSEKYVLYASIENAANAEIACLRGRVDLILMDVCTAEEESGLKAAAKIKQYNPKIKIIIMTSMPEHSFIQKAKACGCNGFWYKEYGSTALMEVCDRVMNGEYVYPEDTPVIRIGYSNSAEFTSREFDIIRELTQGRKYEEIAVDLGYYVKYGQVPYQEYLAENGLPEHLTASGRGGRKAVDSAEILIKSPLDFL